METNSKNLCEIKRNTPTTLLEAKVSLMNIELKKNYVKLKGRRRRRIWKLKVSLMDVEREKALMCEKFTAEK